MFVTMAIAFSHNEKPVKNIGASMYPENHKISD